MSTIENVLARARVKESLLGIERGVYRTTVNALGRSAKLLGSVPLHADKGRVNGLRIALFQVTHEKTGRPTSHYPHHFWSLLQRSTSSAAPNSTKTSSARNTSSFASSSLSCPYQILACISIA